MIYLINHPEVGQFVHWFRHGEDAETINHWLDIFTYPKGKAEFLSDENTQEAFERLAEEYTVVKQTVLH